MDPNQAWSGLLRAVEDDDWQSATEIAENLTDWIGKGGLPPTITGYESFDRIIARATLQAIAAWEVA